MAARRSVGIVKLRFEKLHFTDHVLCEGTHRKLPPFDAKNVRRIVGRFLLEGIQRDCERNYIRAIAPKIEIDHALGDLSATCPDHVSDLDFEVRCLSGRHRVQAAKEVLPAWDHWWTVEIFDESIPSDLQWSLATDTDKRQSIKDGYIYTQLQVATNADESNRWLSDLTDAKRKAYQQLCNDSNTRLKAGFDGLIDLTGLWSAFSFGILQRLFMACNDELAHYLSLIRTVWQNVLLDDMALFHLLDSQTVSLLELLSPAHSSEDRTTISHFMHEGKIFPAIQDTERRHAIKEKLLRQHIRIPSLRSFLEDCRYLSYGSRILSSVVPPGRKKRVDLRTQYSNIHSGPLPFAESYQRLWFYALRHFDRMLEVKPRKDRGAPTPRTKEPDPRCWRAFALKARDLGFSSTHIEKLMQSDPECDESISLLVRFNPDVSLLSMQPTANRIAELLRHPLSTDVVADESPMLTNDFFEVLRDQRCGVPYERNFRRSSKHLHYRHIYGKDPTTLGTLGAFATPFVFLRDTIRSFFGIEAPRREDSAQDGFVPAIVTMQNTADALRSSSAYSTEAGIVHEQHGQYDDVPVTHDLEPHPPALQALSSGLYQDLVARPLSAEGQRYPSLGNKRKRNELNELEQRKMHPHDALKNFMNHFNKRSGFVGWNVDSQQLHTINPNTVNGYLHQNRRNVLWVLHNSKKPEWRVARTDSLGFLEDVRAHGYLVLAKRRNQSSPSISYWHDLLIHFLSFPVSLETDLEYSYVYIHLKQLLE